MRKRTATPPLEQLVLQVKITNTLLAAQLLQHMTQQAVVGLLKSVGANNQDIADIIGTSYASVAVSVGRIRKAKGAVDDDGETEGERPAEADLREAGDGPERR